MKRYVGWLIREPEPGFKDTWRGVFGPASKPDDVTSSKKVEEVIAWFDALVNARIEFEETLGPQLGFRALVQE